MIVVTTFEQRRNITFLSIEDPLHDVACIVNATYIVLSTAEVSTFQKTVTILFCVFLNIFLLCVLSNELTEVVVCLVVSFLAELNRTFDDCDVIFLFVTKFMVIQKILSQN